MTDNDKAIVALIEGHLEKLRKDECYIDDITDRKLDPKYKAYEKRMRKAYDVLKASNPEIEVKILRF